MTMKMKKIHWTTAMAMGVILTLAGLMVVGYHISHQRRWVHEDQKITAFAPPADSDPEVKTRPPIIGSESLFDCAAYKRGEISEPAEMAQARVKMVEFTALGKSGRQDTFLALPEVAQAYARAQSAAQRAGYELRLSRARTGASRTRCWATAES
jgi:hypothetical protein